MSFEHARLTAYFGERDRSDGAFLADRIVSVAAAAGLERSIVLRGSEGFGLKHPRQSSGLLTLSEDLPMIASGSGERTLIEAAASSIRRLSPEGLVTVEAVGVPGGTGNGATGLGVWLRRGQRLGPEPAYMGVVRLLARQGARAATCLLGVDGTTGSRRERARFFAWNGSVPLLVLATGEPETIYRSADRIQGLLPGAEIELLGDGADPPGCAEQRLTVFGTEVRGPDGRPLHSTLVRNVREAGGSGASALAGIYGFTGGSPPHGDSFFQLRRRVPVLTEIIDTKENCATWEGVVEGLGGRQVAVARAPVTVMRVRAD